MPLLTGIRARVAAAAITGGVLAAGMTFAAAPASAQPRATRAPVFAYF
jgi:hypothetical protein